MPLPPTLDPDLTSTAADDIGGQRARDCRRKLILTAVAQVDVESLPDGVVGRIRAMACNVVVRVAGSTDDRTEEVVRDALGVFADVEAACTRFDPNSPLMRANRRGTRWTRVPRLCFDAIREAHLAYLRTGGVFDPRVHDDLVSLGYDRRLRFGIEGDDRAGTPAGTSDTPASTPAGTPAGTSGAPAGTAAGTSDDLAAASAPRRTEEWRPRFRRSGPYVQVGDRAVDLGGIGKGLAVRWAADVLRGVGPDHLVDAGGDCWCGGRAPGGGPWLVGVEDPHGGDGPVAVLALSDRACGTSSLRVRRWRADGRPVHHLIDPATGLPGGEGLASVTVVGGDPADAEVRAKALFLAGAAGIGERAREWNAAALWVGSDGTVSTTPEIDPYVVWRAR